MELSAERIYAQLNIPECPVYVYDTLDSTNDACRRRLAAGEKQFLLLAEMQTAGRGRSGKSFFSPKGGLYMSLTMQMEPDVVGLTCRAAVVTAEAIERVTGISCGIKWVNDLYLQGRKVCGILTEAAGDSVILGIGVNLHPTVFPDELVHIAGVLNCGDVRECLAAEIAQKLLRGGAFMDEYRRRSLVLGREIFCRVGKREFSALAMEIDDDGGLVVLGPAGRETLRFGEVVLSGSY